MRKVAGPFNRSQPASLTTFLNLDSASFFLRFAHVLPPHQELFSFRDWANTGDHELFKQRLPLRRRAAATWSAARASRRHPTDWSPQPSSAATARTSHTNLHSTRARYRGSLSSPKPVGQTIQLRCLISPSSAPMRSAVSLKRLPLAPLVCPPVPSEQDPWVGDALA